MMVAGTVTDRFGATAELCDRDSECPFVAFSSQEQALQDLETAELINDVQKQLDSNQITKMQAVDELTFAVQARQAQKRANEKNASISDERQPLTSREEKELISVLDIVKDAAADALGTKTQQTPRLQGPFGCMRLVHSRILLNEHVMLKLRSTDAIGGDRRARRRHHGCHRREGLECVG